MRYLCFLIAILFTSCNLDYIEYVQHIESPDKKYNFCLYRDLIGIGDPGFVVLKLEEEIDPKKVRVSWNSTNDSLCKDQNWLRLKIILYDYDELSYFTYDPKIELLENRFLVFSRGGLYFGLYDLDLEQKSVNEKNLSNPNPYKRRVAKVRRTEYE